MAQPKADLTSTMYANISAGLARTAAFAAFTKEQKLTFFNQTVLPSGISQIAKTYISVKIPESTEARQHSASWSTTEAVRAAHSRETVQFISEVKTANLRIWAFFRAVGRFLLAERILENPALIAAYRTSKQTGDEKLESLMEEFATLSMIHVPGYKAQADALKKVHALDLVSIKDAKEEDIHFDFGEPDAPPSKDEEKKAAAIKAAMQAAQTAPAAVGPRRVLPGIGSMPVFSMPPAAVAAAAVAPAAPVAAPVAAAAAAASSVKESEKRPVAAAEEEKKARPPPLEAMPSPLAAGPRVKPECAPSADMKLDAGADEEEEEDSSDVEVDNSRGTRFSMTMMKKALKSVRVKREEQKARWDPNTTWAQVAERLDSARDLVMSDKVRAQNDSTDLRCYMDFLADPRFYMPGTDLSAVQQLAMMRLALECAVDSKLMTGKDQGRDIGAPDAQFTLEEIPGTKDAYGGRVRNIPQFLSRAVRCENRINTPPSRMSIARLGSASCFVKNAPSSKIAFSGSNGRLVITFMTGGKKPKAAKLTSEAIIGEDGLKYIPVAPVNNMEDAAEYLFTWGKHGVFTRALECTLRGANAKPEKEKELARIYFTIPMRYTDGDKEAKATSARHVVQIWKNGDILHIPVGVEKCKEEMALVEAATKHSEDRSWVPTGGSTGYVKEQFRCFMREVNARARRGEAGYTQDDMDAAMAVVGPVLVEGFYRGSFPATSEYSFRERSLLRFAATRYKAARLGHHIPLAAYQVLDSADGHWNGREKKKKRQQKDDEDEGEKKDSAGDA